MCFREVAPPQFSLELTVKQPATFFHLQTFHPEADRCTNTTQKFQLRILSPPAQFVRLLNERPSWKIKWSEESILLINHKINCDRTRSNKFHINFINKIFWSEKLILIYLTSRTQIVKFTKNSLFILQYELWMISSFLIFLLCFSRDMKLSICQKVFCASTINEYRK